MIRETPTMSAAAVTETAKGTKEGPDMVPTRVSGRGCLLFSERKEDGERKKVEELSQAPRTLR